MQTRYGEGGIYINKPKRMRQYLLQQSPNHNQIKHKSFAPLYKSLEKEQAIKQSINFGLRSELVELVTSTKNKIQQGSDKQREKAMKMSINISKMRKTSLMEEAKYEQKAPIRVISQLNLISNGVRAYEYRRKGSMLMPSSTMEKNRKNMNSFREGSQKYTRKGTSSQKESEKMFNFKLKNRAINRRSLQLLKTSRNLSIKEEFMDGFKKNRQLGKGGFAVVWQAEEDSTGKKYAVKEIDALNQFQTHVAEIAFSSFFFDRGKPKLRFQNHPGIKTLLTMYRYQLRGVKAFIAYEKCTSSLGEIFFDIFEQRVIQGDHQLSSYVLVHKPMFKQLRNGCNFLKNFIYQIAQALQLLSGCNIVHSDVKTSNILINLSEDKTMYSFKLIDYGSSFFFQNLGQYRLATPEYMPPQMINFLNKQKGRLFSTDLLQFTKEYKNFSAIDMWGLGCIIVQLIHGVPLWLNNKVRIKVDGVQKEECGKFATESRSYIQILQRQLTLIKTKQTFFLEENNTRIMLDDKLKAIISRMLELNPELRIKPAEVVALLSADCE